VADIRDSVVGEIFRSPSLGGMRASKDLPYKHEVKGI